MPVAGKEEIAVKPVAPLSADYISSVPIKKRRYLLYGTPEEPSAQPAENDTCQKEQYSIAQGSTLSNASIGTSSSVSGMTKNSGPEGRKGDSPVTKGSALQRAADHVKFKLEEPNLTLHSNSLKEMAGKEELLGTDLSVKRPIISGNTNLQLGLEKALLLEVRTVINSGGKGKEKCSSDTSTIIGSTELSLGLKENLIPSMGRQESDGSYLNQESVVPFSLDLSLNERKGNDLCKTNDVHSSTGSEKMPRSNWDLNTTMDAWEGPVRDAATDQHAASGLNTGSGLVEVKPMLGSALRVGAGVASENKFIKKIGHPLKPMLGSALRVGAGVASENKFIKKIGHMPNLAALSTPTGQQCNSMDSLNLRLSPSFPQSNFDRESSSISAKVGTSKVVSNICLPKVLVSAAGTLASVIKAEPVDANLNQDPKRPKINFMRPVDCNRTVKQELIERCNEDKLKFSNLIPPKFVNPRSVKSEALDGNDDVLEKVEGTSHQSGEQVLGQYNHSSVLRMTSTSQLSDPPGKPPCSTEMNRSGDVLNHSNSFNHTPVSHGNREVPKDSGSTAEDASRRVSVTGVHDNKKSEAEIPEDTNANAANSNIIDEMPCGSPNNESASVSDEEKVNISGDMIEEDSYGSDCESDGNHAVAVAMDIEQRRGGDDDYEDGEVRDPELPITKEGHLHEENEERFNHGGPDYKKINVDGSLGDESTSPHAEGKDAKSEDLGETNNNQIEKCDDVDNDDKPESGTCKFNPFQSSQAIQVQTSEPEDERAIKRKPLDALGQKDAPKDQEMECVSDEVAGVIQGTLETSAQCVGEVEKKIDVEEKNDSAFSKMEASLNADDGTKEVSSGCNHSRIINLSQASNAILPSKMRSIASRPLPSRVGNDRLADVALDGEKLHPRGRDDIYMDGSPKFSRERHQDQLPRNSRWNFTRGRGRGSGRFDSGRGEWKPNRSFDSEFYSGPTEFRIPRHKYTAPDADLEYSTYNMAPDSGFVGTGRGGRKLISEEDQIFRHLPSRRRSPGGRDGPAGRGLQMIRRVPRNVSPSRCINDEGSELAELRRNEKFMRGFPDDNMDPGFSRTQHPYEGGDGHFMRGNRNFPSGQKRGLPRIRSKSPVRSRTRSPGPWSSPRRRSPDGFSGHPEMPRRRSPAIFRVERMRSPERPCFPSDMVRRQGSPPYLPRPNNDLRDMEPGREHGHPRSVVPNRSPTGRVLLRNNRRFDIVDSREREDANEYFGGPIHSGRFHELGGDGNGENRRRFGERRGPVRSFRPPYNGADGENFHHNAEDATRPFRFGPEDDSEFNERGNARDRDFDRRFKSRPGNAPRRTRNIEEQEGNFRNGGQPWHDEGFDERVKRKRF